MRDAQVSSGHAGRERHGGDLLVADATAAGSAAPAASRTGREDAQRPASYRERAGDSLWRVAVHSRLRCHLHRNRTRGTRLWELNRERIGTGNPDLIFPGQTLRV